MQLPKPYDLLYFANKVLTIGLPAPNINPLYFTGNLVAYIPGETLALSKIDVLLIK
jgi:hypothetical protein